MKDSQPHRARFRPHWMGFGATVLALLAPVPAMAQDSGDFLGSDIPFNLKASQGYAVRDRPHTELEPLGLHVGSFVFFPAASVGAGYSTNVYGQTRNTVGDAYVTFNPQGTLTSQWNRHQLEFSGSAGLKQFATQTVRSEAAYSLQATGRIDLGADQSNIVALIHRGRAFEAQNSGSFPQNSAGTIGYNQTDATVRGTFVLNRLRFTASQKVNDLEYSDATSLTGSLLPQRFRNRTEYNSALRTEFAIMPSFALFGEGAYNQATYHVETPSQPLRSNHTVRLIGGGNFSIDNLVRVMIGAGYEQRDYDLSYYRPISGFTFDARAQWLATELTTVNIQATRKIEDAINARSPGYFATAAKFRIDHELLRYALVYAGVDYERDDFVALSRNDTQKQFSVGAIYSINRHLKLMPSVTYLDRSSVGANAGQNFKDLRLFTSIMAQW